MAPEAAQIPLARPDLRRPAHRHAAPLHLCVSGRLLRHRAQVAAAPDPRAQGVWSRAAPPPSCACDALLSPSRAPLLQGASDGRGIRAFGLK